MGKIIRNIVTIITFLLFLNVKLYAEPIISGKVFYNYRALLDTTNYNAFNIERAYLTLSNKISESISYKVTYDVGKNEAGSSQTAFLKTAMVKWRTNFGDIIIGMQGMNMFKTMENTWGHRFINKSSMDEFKFSSSADMGIGIARSFGSIFSSILVTNGSGYKNPEDDSHKKISIHTIYGEKKLNKNKGFNIGGSISFEPYDFDSVTIKNTNTLSLFSGYSNSYFRGGLELNKRDNNDIKSQIISIYGTYNFYKKISILARLDNVDFNINTSDDNSAIMIIGVHYLIENGFIIAPTYRFKRISSGRLEKSIIINFQFKF